MTLRSRSQGSTTELWSIFKEYADILYIYNLKLEPKVGKPQETSLIQPSIQPMWANLSIYNLGDDKKSKKLYLNCVRHFG